MPKANAKRNITETSPESPQSADKKTKMSGLEGKISTMYQDLVGEMRKSEERLSKLLMAKIDQMEAKIEVTVKAVKGELQKLTTENTKLKAQNDKISRRLFHLERDQRRNNIIVTGIEARSAAEAHQIIKSVINPSKGSNVELSNVRVLKTASGTKVIATCRSLEEKLHIMRQKKHLRGPKGNPVYVSDDLTPEDSEIQFQARLQAKRMRNEGKDVQIGFGRLRVDGIWYMYEQATQSFSRKQNF